MIMFSVGPMQGKTKFNSPALRLQEIDVSHKSILQSSYLEARSQLACTLFLCLVGICRAGDGVIDQLGVIAELLERRDGRQHAGGALAIEKLAGGLGLEEVLVEDLLQHGEPAAYHLDDL